MRLRFQISIIFLISALVLNAQKRYTFTAKDGTTTDVVFKEMSADEGRNSSFYGGVFKIEGGQFIGYSCYVPTKCYVNAMAGISGGQIDGNIFFSNKIKEKTVKQVLNVSANGSKYYVGEIPIQKRISYGLHLGAGYTDYTNYGLDYTIPFSTGCSFVGLSLLTAKHLNYLINNEKYNRRTGTFIFRLNIDYAIYFGQKYYEAKGEPYAAFFKLEDIARKSGWRVYIDGKKTVLSRNGKFGINYLLGIAKTSKLNYNIQTIVGLGLGYNF